MSQSQKWHAMYRFWVYKFKNWFVASLYHTTPACEPPEEKIQHWFFSGQPNDKSLIVFYGSVFQQLLVEVTHSVTMWPIELSWDI